MLSCRQMRVFGIMFYCFIRPSMRRRIWTYIRRKFNLKGPLNGYLKIKIATAHGAILSPSGIPFWQFMHLKILKIQVLRLSAFDFVPRHHHKAPERLLWGFHIIGPKNDLGFKKC